MSIELFLRNIKYLFKYNLKHIEQRASPKHDDHILGLMFAAYENEKELCKADNFPQVLDIAETVQLLNNSNKSFCRFGDGEIALMQDGRGGVFQKYDDRLAHLLKEVITSKNDNLLIGINYYFFNSPKNLHQRQEIFYRCISGEFRERLLPYLSLNHTYGDSLISMPYHLYRIFDFKSYYKTISKLWAGKDIVIICGKTVFSSIKYNCFDNAKSIEYIFGPRINAFSEFDSLLDQALSTSTDKIKFIILGQTATALAYQLCLNGHRAIDIGHLAKDYNSWCMQEKLDNNAIRKFYDKD